MSLCRKYTTPLLNGVVDVDVFNCSFELAEVGRQRFAIFLREVGATSFQCTFLPPLAGSVVVVVPYSAAAHRASAAPSTSIAPIYVVSLQLHGRRNLAPRALVAAVPEHGRVLRHVYTRWIQPENKRPQTFARVSRLERDYSRSRSASPLAT